MSINFNTKIFLKKKKNRRGKKKDEG